MFGLIRRISHSVIPRPDRPWEDDPTSNAPQTGRKRRLSSTERNREVDDKQSSKKKIRGDEHDHEAVRELSSTPLPLNSGTETEEVKEVTRGVEEVELKDTKSIHAPETIPLPDEEDSGELDEPTILSSQDAESHTHETAESGESVVDKDTLHTIHAEDIPLPEDERTEEAEKEAEVVEDAGPSQVEELDPHKYEAIKIAEDNAVVNAPDE
ncbi:hypothetical protein BD779DRAFT_1620861 [Infundibulicybe gibba]|nr:hypothetical protein BD779DRAFT_1620861 [Infundibulicybe gibba]